MKQILPAKVVTFIQGCLFIFFFFGSTGFSTLFGQDTTNEEVKRLQRAIFINNFAQQIIWSDLGESETFKIGVLGSDRTVIDLQALSQKRRIFNKPVEVKRFELVKDIDDIHLLYVNNKYNYDIDYILNKIKGKEILLVTEDYKYNSSMINMVNVGNTFEYEINEDLIKNQNFIVSSSLKDYSISSAEKWKQLYRDSQNALKIVSEEKTQQQKKIKEKDRQVDSQNQKIESQEKKLEERETAIRERNQRLAELSLESDLHQKNYEEKAAIEQELETNIREQLVFINDLSLKIDSSTSAITEQKDVLRQQNSDIAEKETILAATNSELKTQKTVNLLLIVLASVLLLGSLLIYRNYRNKKRLNNELAEKNQAIREQAVELERKNKELEQFAYIASHDLKEPLNSISSLIDMLREDYEDKFDESGKESIHFIKNSSDRMKYLIEGLLEYSRLGKEVSYKSIDCNKLMIDLKLDLKHAIDRTGAAIKVKDLPVIQGSDFEIRMLFQNLISNAMKFVETDVHPKIEISCEKQTADSETEKSYWKFSIMDNGIGIPEMYQERIFSIFQRLHSREIYEGTGIGLAHCKKIVETHGGQIWLDSEVGKGSTFYVTIPV
ncbi:YfiR/HmsC family protein [Ulvibacter antarcticus]|uniref:YfiR/HmsC family protein n=1 Tax=Ulvibacter antarcticus TaxID=442714 RepID=UPI001B87D766|nr:YfiR/HmsC family protein [Ulvibacter antarcticus]